MSLSIFAYAQGKGDDTNVSVDPWIYGGESGLKDQKVTIKKSHRYVRKCNERNGYLII